ncbi:unnamed protein product [Prorocentrum cordatum]|uniref:PSI domain-containing protein n=1 Tax=Prorocentrum cordatum TaxID=2364126 RepID=A0ABN9PJX3_9DINO|nr:unnamed protein product [Polarella glacialis]
MAAAEHLALMVEASGTEEVKVPEAVDPKRVGQRRIVVATLSVAALATVGSVAFFFLFQGFGGQPAGSEAEPELELEITHEELLRKVAMDLAPERTLSELDELDFEPDDAELVNSEEARAETIVWCGGHHAETCAACGDHSGWCNGDCEWKNNMCIDLPEPPDLSPENPFGCPIENGIMGGGCRARTASIHFNFFRPKHAREPMWYYNEVYPTESSTTT